MSRIETERLILRNWQDSDIEPWVAMNADSRVMEFFTNTYNHEEVEAGILKMHTELVEELGYGWWVVEIKETGRFAGVIILQAVPFEASFTPSTEIGWYFNVEAWGNGYATESAVAVLKFAFDVLGHDEIVAMTSRLNQRSRRVMQRLGMHHDPADDFLRPDISNGHPLQPHVLYRLRKSAIINA